MFFKITRKSRALIIVLAVCLLTAFVPTVFAQPLTSPSDSSAAASGSGFTTLDEDGGLLLIGTAKVPSEDGGDFVSVKYIYSDGLMLNQKSAEIICRELKYCGMTISQEMLVSNSDISDDQMTDKRSAIFACGSAAEPTVLSFYEPRKSAEASFKQMYPAYNFSVSGYTSLKNLFEGNDNVTLSEDGETAYTSLILKESYTEKVINGKTVLVLTVNSEFKYSFKAPKMKCERDENYVSDSDWHYPDVSASDTEATTSSTSAANTTASSSVTESSATSSTASSTTSTSAPAQITAAATPVVTATEPGATSTTLPSTTATSTTVSTTQKSTTTSATTTQTTSTSAASSTSTSAAATTSATTSVTANEITTVTGNTTTSTTNTNPVFTRTTINSLSSQRGIVNTRKLPLNIRSGPGKNYMVVTVLPKGAYVTVLDTENPDWYMVKTMGKVVGYAYSKYIRIM